jgi:7-cyano-7-deazaguanine synthase in queuosine biosynthesis
MTIYNIIIKENGQDSFAPPELSNEKYVTFDLGANSAFVSSYVWNLFNSNKIVPSAPAADLMDLAIAIYTSDQIISREINGFQGWSRHMRIHFSVSDSIMWEIVKPDLEQMLSFLSGDKWELIFRERIVVRNIDVPLIRNPDGITKVSLLSGGLDSFIGSIDLLEKKEKVAFVSHYKRGAESPRQSHVYAALTRKYDKSSFRDYKFFVQPNQSHPSFSKEDTSRARSFLFLTLGLVLASALDDNIDMIVPENGLISLNVPLTQTRLSSHSTRTTHPYYISLLQKVVLGVGIKNQIVNPYRFKTKGQMMIDCANQQFLLQNYPGTLSCSHSETSRFVKGAKPGVHCGYCVPCIIRQAAEKAFGGIKTNYSHQIKSNPPDPKTGTGRDLRAFKMALEEIGNIHRHSLVLRILKSGPLPFKDQKDLDDYIEVYSKGMDEVRKFLQ